MTNSCPICQYREPIDADILAEAVDEVAELIIRTRLNLNPRLNDANRFHDMLRERLLAEERLQ